MDKPKKYPSLHFREQKSCKQGLLETDHSFAKRAMECVEEDYAKLSSLCLLYGIPDGPYMFFQLALELARELYPEPKKRGRKSKWTNLNKGALVVEVERLVRPNDSTHGIEWACTQLARQHPWVSFLETKESEKTSRDPAEALRKTYFGFKDDRWANICRDAFKMHEIESTLDEWEDFVVDAVNNPDPK